MNLQIGFDLSPKPGQNLKTMALKQLVNFQARFWLIQWVHAKYCINVQLIHFSIYLSCSPRHIKISNHR